MSFVGFVDWQEDTPEKWGDRAMWGANDKWRNYRYATHILIFAEQIIQLLDAFTAIYGPPHGDMWTIHIEPVKDRSWYEVFVYTNDLDWRPLNRLHGDLLPPATYYIFGNSQMGIEPIPYVRNKDDPCDDASSE